MTDALREAAIAAQALLEENIIAFGPCDHEVGICNCDIARGIESLRAALARPSSLGEQREQRVEVDPAVQVGEEKK